MRSSLVEVAAITDRILTGLFRTRRSLLFWTIFPALMLLLFGLIYAGGSNSAKSFDATAPGILIGAALFFSCLGGPVALIVAERERRTLRRLLLSPLRPSSYFLGIVLSHVVIAFGQMVIVYGLAFLFGGTIHGSLLLCLVIVILSVFTYVGIGVFFGTRFAKRTEDVNGPVAAFGVPLLVLGGTFFPSSMLPPYLYTVAHFDPVFHMNQALKGVSAQGLGVSDIRVYLFFLSVFAVLSLVLGVHSYQKLLSKERAT